MRRQLADDRYTLEPKLSRAASPSRASLAVTCTWIGAQGRHGARACVHWGSIDSTSAHQQLPWRDLVRCGGGPRSASHEVALLPVITKLAEREVASKGGCRKPTEADVNTSCVIPSSRMADADIYTHVHVARP